MTYSYMDDMTVPLPSLYEGRCWVCGREATRIDLAFEAPVCGGTCIWAAYEAMRLHDTKWRAW